MTRNQLAVVRSLAIIGVLLLALGFVVWANTGSPALVGFAVVLLVGTIVAWSTLTPPDAPKIRADGKKSRPGLTLAIIIGVLFVIVMGGGTIAVFLG